MLAIPRITIKTNNRIHKQTGTYPERRKTDSYYLTFHGRNNTNRLTFIYTRPPNWRKYIIIVCNPSLIISLEPFPPNSLTLMFEIDLHIYEYYTDAQLCVATLGRTIVCFWHDSSQWVRVSSFTRFLEHKRRRTTVGRTPLDEWSARRRDLDLTTHNTHNKHPCLRGDSNPQSQQASGRKPMP